MKKLILYHQPECHLCDEAEAILLAAGLDGRYLKVDIETDLELLKSYGIHVPVLKMEGKSEELFWPFDQQGLMDFLGNRE